MMTYDISSDSSVDLGATYWNGTVPARGEYTNAWYHYTQFNETTVFSINYPGDGINVYDLPSLSNSNPFLAHSDLGTAFPTTLEAGAFSCLASSQTPTATLYVVGGAQRDSGRYPMNKLQVLRLNNMEWLSSIDSMNDARLSPACIVANDRLWAWGGFTYQESSVVTSVEAVNITDIENEQWQSIGTISNGVSHTGIAVVDNVIFIIGGQDTSRTLINKVMTIDTVTGTISEYEDTYPYVVQRMSVIAVDRTIYGIGGVTTDDNGGWPNKAKVFSLDMLSALYISSISSDFPSPFGLCY